MNARITATVAIALAASVLSAAPKKKSAAAPAGGEERGGNVRIEQFPRLGRSATLTAPAVQGGSTIGQAFTKPRKWIVLETKYSTDAKWQDQLTFTWHVLLETKSASEKAKEDIPPYSYFTASTTYVNIPQGTHAASVCLHPSYLERYGEPKAVGLVVSNRDGEILFGDCESEIKGIASHPKDEKKAFWNDRDIMDAKKDGEPMIERRQGLQDRSKTIWALVNPNDYEMTVQ